MQKTQQLILISGLSGSGISTALHALEDLGFYAIDKLPLALLPNCLALRQSQPQLSKLAIGLAVRGQRFFEQALPLLDALRQQGQAFELLFLDAEDAVLLRRYRETRRPHPLDPPQRELLAAIATERQLLSPLEPYIDRRIDSSALNVHELRAKIVELYAEESPQMRIHLLSFAFKKGLPPEADLLFDLRFLKNPYFVSELKDLSGLDRPVYDYVLSQENAQHFLTYCEHLLQFLLPLYATEGKRYLNIALGCTGGQHRSVAMVEALFKRLQNPSYLWQKSHRALPKLRAQEA